MKRFYAATGMALGLVVVACGANESAFGNASSGATTGTTSTTTTSGVGGAPTTGPTGPTTTQASTGATMQTSTTASAGGAGGGTTACINCDDVLKGGDPMTACTMNGPPSSAELWTAYATCVCTDKCADKCSTACQGGTVSSGCTTCVAANCFTQYQQCANDSMATCAHCSAVLAHNATPSMLCPSSQMLFDNLAQCICTTGCSQQCGNNVCAGTQASGDCANCVQTTCSSQVSACLADQ